MRGAHRDTGAAAVEFALVLPILALVICGIIDFGRAYNAQLTLTHAAREGARVWALGGTYDQAKQRVADSAVGLTGINVTTTTCTFGQKTTLKATVPFSYLTPLVASLAPSSTTLTSEGVMRCGG